MGLLIPVIKAVISGDNGGREIAALVVGDLSTCHESQSGPAGGSCSPQSIMAPASSLHLCGLMKSCVKDAHASDNSACCREQACEGGHESIWALRCHQVSSVTRTCKHGLMSGLKYLIIFFFFFGLMALILHDSLCAEILQCYIMTSGSFVATHFP